MKISNKILAFIFLSFLLIAGAINFILPDKEYSESEKRSLTQMPEFNVSNIMSGKFMSEFDKYTGDQFFGRDAWVQAKGMSQYLIGNRMLNGVYITDNRYMRELSVNDERLENNLNAILSLAEKSNLPVTLIIAPEAASIYKDELPSYASPTDQDAIVNKIKEKLGDKVKVIYPKDTLNEHRDEYIYFRGDHHWTMLGAYYAYNEFLESKGKEPIAMPEFKTVSDDFKGTMFSKAGIKLPHIPLDTIEVPTDITNDNFLIAVNRGGADEDGVMFDDTHLDTADKYRYFQGGDQPLMAIASIGEGRAFVLKDSFCNVMLPYLARDYELTYVADVRYNRQSPSQYAKDIGADEIILVYGTDSLCNEYALSNLGN